MDKLNGTGKTFHNRIPDMLSHLKLSFFLLLKFLKEKDAISESDFIRFSDEYDNILVDTVMSNAENIVSENPVVKFFDKFRSLLDSGKCYVTKRGEDNMKGKGYVGLEDDNFYYLLPDAIYTEVRKVCSDTGEHFTVMKNQLLKDLGDKGYLIRTGNRNTTNIRDNGGKTMNVMVIDKSRIAELF